MTEFGPEIPLDGKRPDWLTDGDQIIAFEDDNGDWYGLGLSIWYARELDIERPRALRLPHDHAYYLATSKGFTYWPGGETAPEDYDGGEIIYRSGSVKPSACYLSWEHAPAPTRCCPEYDIIGYHPKAASVVLYGPPIVVNGVIPDWLRDTDVGLFENYADSWLGEDGQTLMSWAWGSDSQCPLRIRLPHDHPYYAATDEGFTYWPGGDTAPADWNGKDVLLRDGHTCPGNLITHWGTVDFAPDAEIIGYRPKAPDDTVQVKRMTESEAIELWGDLTKSIDSFELDFVTGLKRLGLIKPEPTRLERFLASTNDPTIEAALEFERG